MHFPPIPSSVTNPPLRAWLAATRPKTLPAAAIPVLVGTSLAYRDDALRFLPALAALLGALLIQMGTNLANDYYDYKRGADSPQRVGPPRAAASGWIAPPRILQAATACFGMAALFGLYLIWIAGWPILLVGILSIASGYAYTGGPYPLGYHGWGDLFVFVFFGLVAVTGTYYVQAATLPLDEVLIEAIPIGALCTAILVVNNLRDLETDQHVGKRTLAVRLGPKGTRIEYAVLVLGAYLVPLFLFLEGTYSLNVLLPLLTLPLAFFLVADVWRTKDPRRLNPLLPKTAQLLIFYGILFAVGVAFA